MDLLQFSGAIQNERHAVLLSTIDATDQSKVSSGFGDSVVALIPRKSFPTLQKGIVITSRIYLWGNSSSSFTTHSQPGVAASNPKRDYMRPIGKVGCRGFMHGLCMNTPHELSVEIHKIGSLAALASTSPGCMGISDSGPKHCYGLRALTPGK